MEVGRSDAAWGGAGGALATPALPSGYIVAVTIAVTMGTPVPAATPVPTGTATWPSEKRPEARPTIPPARLNTVITLPPDPERKLVNWVSAVLNVASVPACATAGAIIAAATTAGTA